MSIVITADRICAERGVLSLPSFVVKVEFWVWEKKKTACRVLDCSVPENINFTLFDHLLPFYISEGVVVSGREKRPQHVLLQQLWKLGRAGWRTFSFYRTNLQPQLQLLSSELAWPRPVPPPHLPVVRAGQKLRLRQQPGRLLPRSRWSQGQRQPGGPVLRRAVFQRCGKGDKLEWRWVLWWFRVQRRTHFLQWCMFIVSLLSAILHS